MNELLCEPETQTKPSTLAALSLRSRMTALLDSDTIDLAAISDAIRREPGFSQFVLQISESLALDPVRRLAPWKKRPLSSVRIAFS